MKGKERDLKLAGELRETFIKKYEKNMHEFEALLNDLGDNCLEKLIYRFKGEQKINLYRDYNALKTIAGEVREKETKEIYKAMCLEDEARAWINDNGKYKGLAFEALYKVFKKNNKLKAFIEEEAKISDSADSEAEAAAQ